MLRALVVDDQGVLSRAEPGMVEVVARLRAQGVRVGLLSNAEGADHPYDVDAAVLSGEAGVRKPQRAAYELVAARLGMTPAECVFVDDLAGNVQGAVAAGMVGVLHVGVGRTVDELEVLLGVALHQG